MRRFILALLCLQLTCGRASALDVADIPRDELVLVVECDGVTTQADEAAVATVASYLDGTRVAGLDVEPPTGGAVRVVWTRYSNRALPSGVSGLPGVCGVYRNSVWRLENDPVDLPPRDPYWQQEWGAEAIGVADAWQITGGVHSTVAVLDSGVDCAHRDLAPNCLDGQHYDAIARREITTPTDPLGHGTHVAGIIAAARDERGVAGMAPHATLLSVRVCSSGGSCSEIDLLAGLIWVRGKASVLNMSLGGSGSSYTGRVCDELADQRESYGAIPVASAGNNGLKGSRYTPMYPATCSAAIGVAAADPPLGTRLADYSTRASVDITAPGTDVMSTYPGGRYTELSGTSMAAPHVSGVVALIQSAWIHQMGRRPTAIEVVHVLQDTAQRICGEPYQSNDFNRRSCGYGLVQAGAGVRSIMPDDARPTPTMPDPVLATEAPSPSATHIPPVQTAIAQLTATAGAPSATPTASRTPTPDLTPIWTDLPPTPTPGEASSTPTATGTPVPPATGTEAAIRTAVAASLTPPSPTTTPDVFGTLTAIAPTPDIATRVAATKTAIAQATTDQIIRESSRYTRYLPAVLVVRPRAACEGGAPWECPAATVDAAHTATAAAATQTALAPTPRPTRSWPLRAPGVQSIAQATEPVSATATVTGTAVVSPTATLDPTPLPTQAPSATATVTPTATLTPTLTPSPTATATPTPTPDVVQTAAAGFTATAQARSTETAVAATAVAATLTALFTPSATPTPTWTPTSTPTNTLTPTPDTHGTLAALQTRVAALETAEVVRGRPEAVLWLPVVLR